MFQNCSQTNRTTLNGIFLLQVAPKAASALSRERPVWVAHENPETLRLIQAGFQAPNSSFGPRLFRTGTEVIAAARKASPAILLLDLALPDIDGFALLKALRQDSRFDDTRILVFSGPEDDCDCIEALAWGASGFLRCPATPALARRLAELLSHWIEGRNALPRALCAELNLTLADIQVPLCSSEATP